MAGDRLAVVPQLTGNPALGPASLLKGVNALDPCHYEQIRHERTHRSKGLLWRLTGESGVPQSGWL